MNYTTNLTVHVKKEGQPATEYIKISLVASLKNSRLILPSELVNMDYGSCKYF